jgi:hypothetical protein
MILELRGAKVLGDFKKTKHRVDSVESVDSLLNTEFFGQ